MAYLRGLTLAHHMACKRTLPHLMGSEPFFTQHMAFTNALLQYGTCGRLCPTTGHSNTLCPTKRPTT